MHPDDLEVLQEAVRRLENPGLAARLSQVIGIPIEKALGSLPDTWSRIVLGLTRSALSRAMDGALLTLRAESPRNRPADKTHKLLAGLSGAVGGSLGIASLAAELPVSASLMLRSIADIARSEGENLQDPETQLACLQVFALGGGDRAKGSDTSYYAMRSFLAKSIGDTARHLASKGLTREGAPLLVKAVNVVAGRFSLPVSQKLAAQSVPALGAVGGATINLIFMDHYQAMARAHFTLRQLERRYGGDTVRQAYQRQAETLRAGQRPLILAGQPPASSGG